MLPSNMLLLILIPLIDVTFSTPTPVNNNHLAAILAYGVFMNQERAAGLNRRLKF